MLRNENQSLILNNYRYFYSIVKAITSETLKKYEENQFEN
jgi:hypothetical protein